MLLVYTPVVKPRLKYIFNLIFGEILGVEYKITLDQEHFNDFIGAKINYSKSPLDKEIFFYAQDLLIEKGIKEQNIEKTNYEKQTVIFAHAHPDSAFPFDPFAASFYLVSRYEEYLPYVPDAHGRFPAKASIAYQSGFLQKPIINIWAYQILEKLQADYPRLESNPLHGYSFLPTYDIDIAYSFKNKGFIRSMGGFLNALKNLNFAKIGDQLQVLFAKKQDPYDTYDYLSYLKKTFKLDPIFFFLVGEYGAFDKNIGSYRLGFRELIQSISDHCAVGIHPSYKSGTNESIIQREIRVLNGIVKKEISRSRQHYLKLSLPQTYELLSDLEIQKEYSMGFPDEIGFRAGVASSFNFYLLTREMPLPLRIYPFCVMDVTLKFYKNLNPDKAIQQICNLIEEVQEVNGLFSPVWHNHSLSETDGWEGWRVVYQNLVEQASLKS